MVRVAIVVGLLAGCSAHAKAPAWPKQSVKDTDGGESLAPRTPAAVAAIEDADDAVEVDAKPDVKPDKPDKPKATPETPKGTATAVPDEPIMTDEIVIEIDD